MARQLTARGVQLGLKLLGPVAAFSVGLALPVVADWLATDFETRLRFSIASVAILGVVLSRWIVPSLGGLRFGMIAAAFGLLAGWLW